MPSVQDRCHAAWQERAEYGGLTGSRIELWLAALHFDRRHPEPVGVMAAAGEGNLPGDPPAPIGAGRRGGRIERPGHGREAIPKHLSHSIRRQPGGEGGDRLVHHQVPGGGRVEASNCFPDAHAADRMKLDPAARLGRQHREQAGAVHRVIDGTRQLTVRLGLGCVFLDQRTNAIDGVEKILGRITRRDGLRHDCLPLFPFSRGIGLSFSQKRQLPGFVDRSKLARS